MALSTARTALEAQLIAAFKNAQLSKNPQNSIEVLARDIAQAIHVYTLQATVNPGQTIIVPSAPSPLIGTTTTPGTLS